MLQMCIEEYRCTLTPHLEFYEEQLKLLDSLERKLANIRKRGQVPKEDA